MIIKPISKSTFFKLQIFFFFCSKTLQTFIDENLWDEVYVFVGNAKFESGLKAPELKKAPHEIRKISDDALKIYVNY